MNVYQLIKRRDELKKTLDHLCRKTNGWAGRDKRLWQSITKVRQEIEHIEEQLKTIQVER